MPTPKPEASRWIVEAFERTPENPHFPLATWCVDADSKLDALRQVRSLADVTDKFRGKPLRVVLP